MTWVEQRIALRALSNFCNIERHRPAVHAAGGLKVVFDAVMEAPDTVYREFIQVCNGVVTCSDVCVSLRSIGWGITRRCWRTGV